MPQSKVNALDKSFSRERIDVDKQQTKKSSALYSQWRLVSDELVITEM